MANDYVSEILDRVAGGDFDDDVAGDDDEIGLDPETNEYINQQVAGLVAVGELTEVGAKRAKKVIKKAALAKRAATPANRTAPRGPMNQRFSQSSRDTERRAPLGFTEDGTGKNFFTLAASIGSTTTMRAKVSRAAHVDRLLIVPSAPGAVVQSIQVGDEEQVLAPGVPAELYGASALTDSSPDNFSPIGPGLDLVVTLRNTTAGAITGTIGTKCQVKR